MKNIHNQQATPNATSKKCSIKDFGQQTNKQFSGHCKAMEEEGDQKTVGKEIWKKSPQQASRKVGGT